MKRRPSYASVTATLALVLSVSGGAYAVTNLPANSVGTAQLQSGAVTTSKLHASSVTGYQVKDHSLTAHDLAVGATAPTQAFSGYVAGLDMPNCSPSPVAVKTFTFKPIQSSLLAAFVSGTLVNAYDTSMSYVVDTSLTITGGGLSANIPSIHADLTAYPWQQEFAWAGLVLGGRSYIKINIQAGTTYTATLLMTVTGSCVGTVHLSNAEVTLLPVAR